MHVPKVDQQLDSTIRALRKQNVGIVIHDDAEMYRILQEVRKILLLINVLYSPRGILFL